MLERSHMSIKQALKIKRGDWRYLWHKYVSFAVLNYNTSYQTSIGCESSRVLYGLIPYSVLDLKTGALPQQIPIPFSQIAPDLLVQREMIYQDVRKNAMQANIKNKAYYDKKATLHNSKKQIKFMSCRRKEIIRQ